MRFCVLLALFALSLTEAVARPENGATLKAPVAKKTKPKRDGSGSSGLNADPTVAAAQAQAQVNAGKTPVLENENQFTAEINAKNLQKQGHKDSTHVGLLAIAVGTAKIAKGKKINKSCKCGAGTPLIVEGHKLVDDGKKSLVAASIMANLSDQAKHLGKNLDGGRRLEGGEYGGEGNDSGISGKSSLGEGKTGKIDPEAAKNERVAKAFADLEYETGIGGDSFIDSLNRGDSISYILEKAPTHVGDPAQFKEYEKIAERQDKENEERGPASEVDPELAARLGVSPEGFSELERALPAVIQEAKNGAVGAKEIDALFARAGLDPRQTAPGDAKLSAEIQAARAKSGILDGTLFQMVRSQYTKRAAALTGYDPRLPASEQMIDLSGPAPPLLPP